MKGLDHVKIFLPAMRADIHLFTFSEFKVSGSEQGKSITPANSRGLLSRPDK